MEWKSSLRDRAAFTEFIRDMVIFRSVPYIGVLVIERFFITIANVTYIYSKNANSLRIGKKLAVEKNMVSHELTSNGGRISFVPA